VRTVVEAYNLTVYELVPAQVTQAFISMVRDQRGIRNRFEVVRHRWVLSILISCLIHGVLAAIYQRTAPVPTHFISSAELVTSACHHTSVLPCLAPSLVQVDSAIKSTESSLERYVSAHVSAQLGEARDQLKNYSHR
jgi:hypothetical protein